MSCVPLNSLFYELSSPKFTCLSIHSSMASLHIRNNNYLEYLGMTSLKAVTAGLVIIKDNPILCYVTSLKWRKLASATAVLTPNANESQYCSTYRV